MSKATLQSLLEKKKNRIPITMLTAYDYSIASVVDRAGIDIILVGDSLANVVLGLDSTKSVGMSEMLYHTKAVRRAVKDAILIGDMPYEAFQVNIEDSVKNARRFIDEAGCDGVKVEWFDRCAQVTEKLVKASIPVMGHIGLTPQTADKLGGFKVQGKDAESAHSLIDEALLLEKLGVFSIVLECVPTELAGLITKRLVIPTIGIGAGPDCDGQVLVINDMLGLFDKYTPKFVKRYANLSGDIKKAVEVFRYEVQNHLFPTKEYSYTMKEEEIEKLKK
jgi:3-methyl-2-oxobutanoate hydroxymethyltransferase